MHSFKSQQHTDHYGRDVKSFMRYIKSENDVANEKTMKRYGIRPDDDTPFA